MPKKEIELFIFLITFTILFLSPLYVMITTTLLAAPYDTCRIKRPIKIQKRIARFQLLTPIYPFVIVYFLIKIIVKNLVNLAQKAPNFIKFALSSDIEIIQPINKTSELIEAEKEVEEICRS